MIRARFYGLAKIVIFPKTKKYSHFFRAIARFPPLRIRPVRFYARIFPVRRRLEQGRTLRNRTKSAPVFSKFPRQAIRIKGEEEIIPMDNLLFVRNYERMLFLGERIQSFRTFSAFIGDVRFRLHRTGSRIDGITHAGSAGPQVVRIYRQRIGYGKPNAVGST